MKTKKQKQQTFKILDKVIYCFYNIAKDKTRVNNPYIGSSGSCIIYTPNDFFIGQITAKETTTLQEYVIGEKRISTSNRYRYVARNRKHIINLSNDLNIHKYNYATHKKLCKKFKIRYKKTNWSIK